METDESQEILESRAALAHMEANPDNDPVSLSLEYLKKCTDNFTSKVLGEGAFGKVYLGTDKTLGLQFAVKQAHFHPDALNEIMLSFRKEISVSRVS